MLHGNPTWSFLLPQSGRWRLRGELPRRRARPHRLRPVRQARRRALRLHACAAGRRPGSAAGAPGPARERHAGAARLGRHDRHGAGRSRHPERVKRLVMLNTAAFHLPAGKTLPWSLWLCRNTPLGPLLVRGLNAFSRGRGPLLCVAWPLPADARQRLSRAVRFLAQPHRACCASCRTFRCGPAIAAMTWFGEVQDGLAPLPRRADADLLGGKDFVFDDDFLAEWRRRFPAAEVHTFRRRGPFRAGGRRRGDHPPGARFPETASGAVVGRKGRR